VGPFLDIMKTKKGDFIELDFTARVKGGNVFDTTKEEEAKKAGLFLENKKDKFKPINLCIGESMTLKGIDTVLVDKEVGKEYEIELGPKDAFGIRNTELIKTVPLSAFKEMPAKGIFVNVNGLAAKVITITSGRALLDFNNPLAGRYIIYRIKINKIIKDNSKKIQTISNIFNIEIADIKIEGKEARVKIKNKKEKDILEKFKNKVKELLNLECKCRFD